MPKAAAVIASFPPAYDRGPTLLVVAVSATASKSSQLVPLLRARGVARAIGHPIIHEEELRRTGQVGDPRGGELVRRAQAAAAALVRCCRAGGTRRFPNASAEMIGYYCCTASTFFR